MSELDILKLLQSYGEEIELGDFTPEELSAKYEDRIFSRIMGSGTKVLPFMGNDIRVTR